MAFIDVRFPDEITYDSVFTPAYKTRVVTSASGFESRNINWEEHRLTCDFSMAVRKQERLDIVIEFFHAMKGQGHSFRAKNWADFKSVGAAGTIDYDDQLLFTSTSGGETEIQIIKTYTQATANTISTITKPVSGTLRVGKNGTEIFSPAAWSADYATGIITLVTPLIATDYITAGYEYDNHMRFNSDELPITLSAYQVGDTGIALIQERE